MNERSGTRKVPKAGRLALAGAIAAGLVLGATPVAAYAASSWYVNGTNTTENQITSSVTTTIKGGSAYVGSTIMRVFTQTYVPGVGIWASSYSDGGVANLSHVAQGNMQERCWWDYVGGVIANNPQISTNCSRTY